MYSLSPLDIAENIARIVESGLFDVGWYAAAYGAALADGSEPLVQFCNAGWKHGNWPNCCFDTSNYLRLNPEVRTLKLNPLIHYICYGALRDRAPSLHFDPVWYRDTYMAPDHVNCLADYLRRCKTERVNPGPGFDSTYYLNTYSGDTNPTLPAFVDYVLHGRFHGRDPSAEYRIIRQSGGFDEAFYLKTYPDSSQSGFPPLYHFCAKGWLLGYKPNPGFDATWYLHAYDDVRAAKLNPFAHYLEYGRSEGRDPRGSSMTTPTENAEKAFPLRFELGDSTQIGTTAGNDLPFEDDAEQLIDASGLFDPDFYLRNYPDVRANEMAPLEHFIRYGWQEGRRPNPYFDPVWYRNTYLIGLPLQNALVHYIKHEDASRYRPIVYFDPGWYRTTYKLCPEGSPLRHFLHNRRDQKVSPTPLFDVDWYVQRFRIAMGGNRDPFAHYLRVGIFEDINTSIGFDACSYRTAYMKPSVPRPKPKPGSEVYDVIHRETLNPLVHFLLRSFPD